MAEFSANHALATAGPDIAFNAGTDIFRITDIRGLDAPAIRAPIDDAPITDGGIVHDFYYGARHFTVEGVLLVYSQTTEAGVAQRRNEMEDELLAALAACLRVNATWSWTPTGLAARSLTVRNEIPCEFRGGKSLAPREFLFGMVAADPTW